MKCDGRWYLASVKRRRSYVMHYCVDGHALCNPSLSLLVDAFVEGAKPCKECLAKLRRMGIEKGVAYEAKH